MQCCVLVGDASDVLIVGDAACIKFVYSPGAQVCSNYFYGSVYAIDV